MNATMTGKEIALAFLNALEARDLAAAGAFLAPGAVMTFPGGNRFATLEELVAWAKGRYRFVRKTYESFDEARRGDVTVVYCRGVLNGEWPAATESNTCLAGSVFNSIRFIDRFEIVNGKIVDQQVWNDLAEARP